MICIEVWLNGTCLCTAGLEAEGVVTTTLYGVMSGHDREGSGQQRFRLNVGGVDAKAGERVTWQNRTLELGDCVMLKIVEHATCDAPASRSPSDGSPDPEPVN
jgi:hypothetical protein